MWMAAPWRTPCKDAAVSADGHHWIATDAGLVEAAAAWRGPLALDTEFRRTDTFYPIPGLYQLATVDGIWLLDPLAINDWTPLIRRLEDSTEAVVMHACSEDLELLTHHLGARPGNLFDTQLAWAFVSEHYSMGYANLVRTLIGVELPRQQTLSNWLRRPLSSAQLRYACADVKHLLPLHDLLRQRLEASGRQSWFASEMAVRRSITPAEPDECYRALPKARQLSQPQLKRLRALCAWREHQAIREDRPRKRVLSDDLLLELARASELSQAWLGDLLPPNQLRRYGQALKANHRAGEAASAEASVPRALKGVERETVKALKRYGVRLARRLDLAAELLCRQRDLEACVRAWRDTGQVSAAYQGWRSTLMGEGVGKALAAMDAEGAGESTQQAAR